MKQHHSVSRYRISPLAWLVIILMVLLVVLSRLAIMLA